MIFELFFLRKFLDSTKNSLSSYKIESTPPTAVQSRVRSKKLNTRIRRQLFLNYCITIIPI
ncbi:hypothetical protein CpB0206 [Chlamydia pneumoniae TW-183]|uniref:Uncharacterized protein n=1 Tax=Chlamydia pneumoniae TaxID=83558 RepID=A0ABN3YPK6_CHLPN|nr:hypothetical protein CpB0206 [Chlamydia pneumoniae TW-183]